MRLSACSCRAEHYQRGHRAWWMKIFSNRRLYRCYACDTELFISPGQLQRKQRKQAAKAARHPVIPAVS